MKTLTISVDFVVSVPEGIEPNDITFDIPIESVRVDSLTDGEGIGVLTGYCTQEYQS